MLALGAYVCMHVSPMVDVSDQRLPSTKSASASTFLKYPRLTCARLLRLQLPAATLALQGKHLQSLQNTQAPCPKSSLSVAVAKGEVMQKGRLELVASLSAYGQYQTAEVADCAHRQALACLVDACLRPGAM